jgi:hypothetical protein
MDTSLYPASRENKMAQQLPKFCERENSKLFAFYSLNGNKNTMKKFPAIVSKYFFVYLNWLKNFF